MGGKLEGAHGLAGWLAPSQAAKQLDVTPTRVSQLADEGRLKQLKTPLGRLVSASSVDALVQERRARKGGRGG